VSEQAERRAELAMALVPVALAALTLLILIEPTVAPAVVNDRLALVIDAATTPLTLNDGSTHDAYFKFK